MSSAGVGSGGALVWALPERPAEVDPLLAANQSEALLSRQIHEPLVESVGAPFEDARRAPGLAVSLLPSNDATVWRVRLRGGIRFGDGARLNAAAVLDNAERWLQSEAGQRLLPQFLIDAPRPDLVRFILPASDPEFDRRLAAPELGIVSPRALRRAARLGAVPPRATGTGTGPFELRERSRDRILLARNGDWWGSARDLGPALDQVELLVVADAAEMLSLLAEGEAQVASGLREVGLERAGEDPLLAVVSRRAGIVAERSVRGLAAADGRAPMLNDVWLTGFGSG